MIQVATNKGKDGLWRFKLLCDGETLAVSCGEGMETEELALKEANRLIDNRGFLQRVTDMEMRIMQLQKAVLFLACTTIAFAALLGWSIVAI